MTFLKFYYPEFEKFINRKLASEIRYELDFSPEPENPCKLSIDGSYFHGYIDQLPITKRRYALWWDNVTNHFDQQQIISIVNLWSSPDDKIEVLNFIEQSFDELANNEAPLQIDVEELPF